MTVPDASAVAQRLRDFITGELMQQPDYPLRNDEALMSGGLIDSFSVAYIGVFIEQAWGIYVPDPELTVETMDTIDLITARVLRG